MRYLLDTNAVIGLLNSAMTPIAAAIRRHAVADIGISIVVHELYFGAYKSLRRDHNLSRLDVMRFEVVDFNKEDAVASGEVRSALSQAGTPIGPYDVLIAGQALCRGLILITANTGEFSGFGGLKLEDWSR